jgi:hypothetical protein
MTAQSIVLTCEGDDSAVAGILSGTIKAQCAPIEQSTKVFVNGKGVIRDGDRFAMNDGNTVGKMYAPGTSCFLAYPGSTQDDKETASLICKTLSDNNGDIDAAYDDLTKQRQTSTDPNWYNSQNVVAAQHFLRTASYSDKESKAAEVAAAVGMAVGDVVIYDWILKGSGFWGAMTALKDGAEFVGHSAGNILREVAGKDPVPLPSKNHAASPFTIHANKWAIAGIMAAKNHKKGTAWKSVVAIPQNVVVRFQSPRNQ